MVNWGIQPKEINGSVIVLPYGFISLQVELLGYIISDFVRSHTYTHAHTILLL